MRVIWVTNTMATIYEPIVHLKNAYKFLFWKKENLLLVGWMGIQCVSHEGGFNTHRTLHTLALRYGVEIPQRKPDGAGEVFAGAMDGWNSFRYKVNTPDIYKEEIKRALGVKK